MKRMIVGLILVGLVAVSSPAAAADKPVSFSIGGGIAKPVGGVSFTPWQSGRTSAYVLGGFTYKLSDLASFFVEARFHYVWGPEAKTASGGTQNASAQFFPMTFGFRF